jgi:hypothetical protein
LDRLCLDQLGLLTSELKVFLLVKAEDKDDVVALRGQLPCNRQSWNYDVLRGYQPKEERGLE